MLRVLDELSDVVNPECPGCRALLRLVEQQAQRMAQLEARVAQLEEKLGQHSDNSHRPPSSDTPAARAARRGRAAGIAR